MNTVRSSVTKNRSMLSSIFFKSLYYTLPFGMFMIACNCLFNSVRKYYLDWMIVILPTIIVLIIASVYEILVMYQQNGFSIKRSDAFTTKKGGFSMSNPNLV